MFGFGFKSENKLTHWIVFESTSGSPRNASAASSCQVIDCVIKKRQSAMVGHEMPGYPGKM